LAEDKIKPQGSKFRCSKCGTVLLIKKPIEPQKDVKKATRNIDKFFALEKEKYEEQRSGQQRVIQVVSSGLLPLFIGAGMTSFLVLSESLPTHGFFAVTVLILVYSSASGVFEYIRNKKTKQKRSLLIPFIQALLFVFIYIVLIHLLN
jgi:hypothetical protein